MLKRLGLRRFAYDWRAEHLPTFDREVGLLQKEGIELTAVWFPADLGDDARRLLAVIKKHKVRPQLWVSLAGGAPARSAPEQRQKVEAHARALRPVAEEAAGPTSFRHLLVAGAPGGAGKGRPLGTIFTY